MRPVPARRGARRQARDLLRRGWLACLGLLLWLAALPLAGAAPAAPPALRLAAADTHVPLGAWLQRWVDTSGQADLAQARRRLAEGGFQPVGRLDSGGYTRAAHWFSAAVQRDAGAADRWVLVLGEPYLDDLQVWVEGADGSLRQVQMGDRHLQAGRPLPGRAHAMPVALGAGPAGAGATRLWIRVRTGSAMNLSADLWQTDAYMAQEQRLAAAWAAAVGLLTLAALVQLVFGLWLRDRMLLAFAFYIGVLAQLYFGTSGLALLAWPQPPPWYDDLVVGAASLAMVAAGSLGSMLVLEVDRHLPRWRWFYLLPAALALAAVPLAVTDVYGTAVAVANLWAAVLCVVNIAVAVGLWWRLRGRLRLLNTVAAVVLGVGASLHMAVLVGLLPGGGLLRHAYVLASIAYLLMTLVAMSVRVGWLRHDKLLAQRRMQEDRRFAAMVAHEFRNPLAGIDRAANLLQRVPDLGPDQVAQRLANIRRQAARLDTLVDSFLVAGGSGDRPLKPLPQPVALAPWLQALRQSLDADACARLQLQVLPAALRACIDTRLLALALHNLIDNALRYSPADRPVLLQAQPGDDGSTLRLVVADQGPGIAEDVLPLLGRPYHRGAASIGQQGSGLGYHFSRQIVQLHGGDLQACNRLPHGLEVTLRLPGALQGG